MGQTAAPTQLVIVRHGETEWNVQGRMQGHLDSPLTATGLAQAQALAQSLQNERFDAFYSSDLWRAAYTAQLIAKPHQASVQQLECLRERNLGIFQGLTRKEIHTQLAEDISGFRIDDPNYQVPKGENVSEFRTRCVCCFENLAIQHAGQRLLIVAHGGVLISLFKHTLGLAPDTPRRFKILNTGLNVFSYERGIWLLETWGNVHHLQQMAALDEQSLTGN